ncbi:MAG: hypothetical protein QXR27_02215 [Archaeoglobaceae archaeon]
MRKSIILIGRENSKIAEEVARDFGFDLFFIDINTDLESFTESLGEYEKLIVIATLGSWEGELLIEFVTKCKSKLILFCFLRSRTIQEIMISRNQADEILNLFPDFQGAMISNEMPPDVKIEALKLLMD